MNSFRTASEEFKYETKFRFKVIPNWNNYCTDKYREAHNDLLNWVSNGGHTQGNLCDEMKRKRVVFKDALDYCERNEQKMRDYQLLKNKAENDVRSFWKNVNSRRSNKIAPAAYIADVDTDQSIPDMFATMFSSVTATSDDPVH